MSSEGAHMVARSHHHQRHSIKWEACRRAEFYQTLVLTTNNTLVQQHTATHNTQHTRANHQQHTFRSSWPNQARLPNTQGWESGHWGLAGILSMSIFFYKKRISPFYSLNTCDFELFVMCVFVTLSICVTLSYL